jgi:cation diffusion facilitator family transporter
MTSEVQFVNDFVASMSQQQQNKFLPVQPTCVGETINDAWGLRGLKIGSQVLVPAQVPIPLQTMFMGKPEIDEEKGWSTLPKEVSKARKLAWESLRLHFTFLSSHELKSMKPATRQYYAQLYNLIDQLESADVPQDTSNDHQDQAPQIEERIGKLGPVMIYLSLMANLFIFGTKIVVAVASGALVVYASALDSFLDILSGSILSLTTWLMSRPSPYQYPVGKARLEPLGVIVFAAIMGTTYANVVLEAVKRFVEPAEVRYTLPVMGMLIGIVAMKAFLYIVCRAILSNAQHKSVSLQAQAEDHFNDCITNTFSALGTFFASSHFAQQICGLKSPLALSYIDPIVTALFSIYVIYVWVQVAQECITSLLGQTAPPEMLQKITYLAAVHCTEIRAIDTVRAYTFGQTYIAEVDIVLPEEMSNRQTHDIAESLQIRIEALEEIERCFVHVDWETTHKPEHKS